MNFAITCIFFVPVVYCSLYVPDPQKGNENLLLIRQIRSAKPCPECGDRGFYPYPPPHPPPPPPPPPPPYLASIHHIFHTCKDDHSQGSPQPVPESQHSILQSQTPFDNNPGGQQGVQNGGANNNNPGIPSAQLQSANETPNNNGGSSATANAEAESAADASGSKASASANASATSNSHKVCFFCKIADSSK